MRKWIALLVFVGFLVGCGGGGGGGTCDFIIEDFLNGPNAQMQDSFWSCQGGGGAFDFVAFEDGTGFSTGAGVFTWQETDCREIDFVSSAGSGIITDIQGSIQSGIITYTQISNDLGTFSVGCFLVVL